MSTIQVINAKHPSSASNNIVLDSSGNATFAGTAAMSSSFLRNRLINGGMQIWQRGTTFSTGYTADRWFVGFGDSPTFARSTDVPSAAFQFSMSVTGSNFITLTQRIESVNTYDLAFLPVTVSFWVKQTSGAGTNSIGVQLFFPTAADNYTSVTGTTTNLINGTSGWAYVSTTFAAGALVAQAANGIGLSIYANVAGSSTFLVTGVQLEVGTVATPFERRLFGQEFMLCQRYFQQVGAGWTGMEENATQFSMTTPFWVTMRAAPTSSLISTSILTRIPSVSTDRTITGCSIAAIDSSTYANWVFFNCSGGNVSGRFIQNRNGANILNVSAEL